MPKIVWLIDDNLFNSDEQTIKQDLIKTIEKDGQSYQLITLKDITSLRLDFSFIYMLYGSIPFVKKFISYAVNNNYRYYSELHDNNFNVNVWSGYYYGELLNQDLTFEPFWQFKHNYENQSEFLSGTDTFFIRPNSGFKPFSGQIVSEVYWPGVTDIQTFINTLEQINKIDKSEMIVQAPQKEIKKEYRFLIVDNEVIDGASYGLGKLSINEYPEGAYELADKIAKHSWKPADSFIVDIAEISNYITKVTDYETISHHNSSEFRLGGHYQRPVYSTTENIEYKVIEINALNTSFWYSMNKEKIVSAINNKIHKDFL